MLKSYYEADNVASVTTIAPVYGEEDTKVSGDSISTDSVTISGGSCTLQNSDSCQYGYQVESPVSVAAASGILSNFGIC